MNKIIKILKKVTVILAIGVMNILCLENSIYAADLTSANVYMVEDCGQLLTYKGVPVITSYIEYNCNGEKYPAYCLDKTKPGAETGSYGVKVESALQDVQIWKIITNGYPYKTIEELGVKNRKEAFTATKHALYCYIHKNNPDDYAPIEDIEGSPSNLAGTRTLMALKKILQDAENSTETKISSSLTINTSDWKYNPEINKDYVYKTYSVTSGAPIQKYKVTLARDNGQDIGGIKLVDENNNEADEFQSNQNFKIMIPIKNMTEDGGFNLTVEAKVKTKPVLYGASQKEGTQDYVLTTGMYEDGRGYISQKYQKNETKLIILKKDQDTGNMLEGVEFELLDEKYKPIYTDLKTDKNGKIVIENMIPGRYFLKETKSVDGYEVYPELVTVDLELQQEMTVTINNKKSEEPKVEKKVANKEVSVEYITNDKIEGKKTNIQETKIKEVRKLPVAGM